MIVRTLGLTLWSLSLLFLQWQLLMRFDGYGLPFSSLAFAGGFFAFAVGHPIAWAIAGLSAVLPAFIAALAPSENPLLRELFRILVLILAVLAALTWAIAVADRGWGIFFRPPFIGLAWMLVSLAFVIVTLRLARRAEQRPSSRVAWAAGICAQTWILTFMTPPAGLFG